ncbi:hypothetical protein yinte0001_380 [Yersinia intermedia ATCC 29909]|nr:hypothetical protein yinte0001_380 [Yersinia intermedia ATCC 29909]
MIRVIEHSQRTYSVKYGGYQQQKAPPRQGFIFLISTVVLKKTA